MIPKVVTDAGYTAVGLGVLAVQQVQTRRRKTRSRVAGQLHAGRQSLESAVGQVKARIEPLQAKLEPLQAKVEPIRARIEPIRARIGGPVSAALDHLPRVPAPVGGLLASGRNRIQAVLHHDKSDAEPPARDSDQGEVEAGPEAAPATETDGS